MPVHSREKASRDIGRGRNPNTNEKVNALDQIAVKAEELEAQLDTATTFAELEAVTW